MFDRYQLRYFLAVVDQGTFTRAASACSVSQPTLSVGISKLEDALGRKLFRRNSRRVELTEAGTRFLAHARKIESEFNSAQNALLDTVETPLLRVGVLRSLPGAMLSEVFEATRSVEPAAARRLELVEANERELIGHLSRGRIDFALTLVERGGGRFLEEPLYTEGYTLALPEDHHLAGPSALNAEVLADEVMILRPHCEALSETSRHFTERGVRPHFAYRSTNDERVLEMVSAGLGVTVMPECFAAQGVVYPRLAGFDLTRNIGIAYGQANEDLAKSPPVIIEVMRALCAAGKK